MIKHICDFCKKDIKDESYELSIPVWHRWTITNGKGVILSKINSGLNNKDIEICESCAAHLANILYDNFDIYN